MHEVIQIGVGLDPALPVPDIKAIACGGMGKIDIDFFWSARRWAELME